LSGVRLGQAVGRAHAGALHLVLILSRSRRSAACPRTASSSTARKNELFAGLRPIRASPWAAQPSRFELVLRSSQIAPLTVGRSWTRGRSSQARFQSRRTRACRSTGASKHVAVAKIRNRASEDSGCVQKEGRT